MNPLEQRIKYKFRNSLLLAEALTHPSLGHETQRHHFDNQRLEFLGDAVLQLIFTEYLFDHYPERSEGSSPNCGLSSSRGKALRIHAHNIGLGRYLMMGKGEEASGGSERASALADAYEALVGALYLDSDYVTVRRIVLTEARDYLETLEVDLSDTQSKGSASGIAPGHLADQPDLPDRSINPARNIKNGLWRRSFGTAANSGQAKGGAKKRRKSPRLAMHSPVSFGKRWMVLRPRLPLLMGFESLNNRPITRSFPNKWCASTLVLSIWFASRPLFASPIVRGTHQ